jgi:hypothetical protein
MNSFFPNSFLKNGYLLSKVQKVKQVRYRYYSWNLRFSRSVPLCTGSSRLGKYGKFKISNSKYGNYNGGNLLLSSFLRRFRLQEFSSPGGCDCKAICRKQALHGQLSILHTYISHKKYTFYKDGSELPSANTAKHFNLVTLVYWPHWKISLILNMVIIP